MLDKKKIQGIFLFKFKMGHKAVETTHINNVFGPGTANKHTVQEILQRRQKPWRWGSEWLVRNWQWPTESNHSSWSSKELKGDHSVVVWHLKQTGKVKKLEEWKPRDLTKNKKYHCSEVLFSLILCSNEPFLDHIGMSNKRWILYNWRWLAQRLDGGEAPKHFPEPNSHQKKVMDTGGLLPVWPTTAFWIPVRPLYLRSMLSKSTRCTKNSNICSQHQSTERAQCFSTTTPNRCTSNTSKIEQTGLWSFASFTIFTWPLTNRHFFKHLDNFCMEKASTTSKMQKMFSKNSSNPEAIYFSLAKCVDCN